MSPLGGEPVARTRDHPRGFSGLFGGERHPGRSKVLTLRGVSAGERPWPRRRSDGSPDPPVSRSGNHGVLEAHRAGLFASERTLTRWLWSARRRPRGAKRGLVLRHPCPPAALVRGNPRARRDSIIHGSVLLQGAVVRGCARTCCWFAEVFEWIRSRDALPGRGRGGGRRSSPRRETADGEENPDSNAWRLSHELGANLRRVARRRKTSWTEQVATFSRGGGGSSLGRFVRRLTRRLAGTLRDGDRGVRARWFASCDGKTTLFARM